MFFVCVSVCITEFPILQWKVVKSSILYQNVYISNTDTLIYFKFSSFRFNSKEKLLYFPLISLEDRKMLLKTYEWSIAMNGCETWRIGEAERKRLKDFEMCCYRRMLKIKWTDRITDEEVLERIGERRSLWKSLKKRVCFALVT